MRKSKHSSHLQAVTEIALIKSKSEKEIAVGKMFIRYSVADYEAWREGFDAHEAAREANGMWNAKVYQSTENPNEVVLVIEIADRLRTEAFASSEEVRLSNLRLGVVSAPERYYFE